MKRTVQLIQSAPPGYSGLGPLPVRVRTRTGELVGSGVTDMPIDVPVGSYFVSVLLPDGREIGLDHRVRPGRPLPEPVGDAPPADAQPAPAMPAPPMMIPRPTPIMAPRSAPPLPEEQSVHAAMWRGDWMRAWAGGAPSLSGSAVAEIGLTASSPTIIAQEDGVDRLLLLPLEDRYRCTVIPYDECRICIDSSAQARAIAARAVEWPDGPAVEFRSIVSEEANTLLCFVESGVLTNMVAVTEDEVRRGEQALSQSGSSVFRAITGAYVLLRANALEGLDRWLAQLRPLGADLPDLLPLEAELAARSGNHRAAVVAIRRWLDQSRCPWFRAGLSYMLDRLRLYLDVSDNQRADFNLDAAAYARFQTARDVLEHMLTSMLTSRYIATFDIPRASGAR